MGRSMMISRRLVVVTINGNNKGITISEKIPLTKLFDCSYFFLLFFILLVIISNQGGSQTKSTSSRQRWLQYQTALSNTGPLGNPDVSSTSGTSSIPMTSMVTRSIATSTSIPPSPTSSSPSASKVVAAGIVTTRRTTPKSSSNNNSRNIYYASGVGISSSTNYGGGAAAGAGRKRISSYEDLQQRFPDGALFENNTSVNLTVPLGDTAFLRCRVKNLGERSISWIRRRDYHILTTGKTTYTNDERFNVLHVEGTDDWTLQIKFVQRRDNGTYECQISTGTGIISFMVNLLIAVPEAFILGNGDEYHVEQGSTINLVCVIEKSPKVPEFIFWYHNDRMINYGSSREVTVKTEPGTRTQSRLTIRDARILDSGNYTCKTAHAEPASIFVYVSQASGLFSGDKIAAIQRRKTSASSASSILSKINLIPSSLLSLIYFRQFSPPSSFVLLMMGLQSYFLL